MYQRANVRTSQLTSEHVLCSNKFVNTFLLAQRCSHPYFEKHPTVFLLVNFTRNRIPNEVEIECKIEFNGFVEQSTSVVLEIKMQSTHSFLNTYYH